MVLVDFDICVTSNGSSTVYIVRGNTDVKYLFSQSCPDVEQVEIIVYSVSKPNHPVTISELTIASSVLYDNSTLMSIDMLEELSYEDSNEVLGSISANEVTVVFDNSKKDFYFNNPDSLIAGQLKRNRKVVPYLGVNIDGTVEWYCLGVYWTYKWTVPVGSLTATAVAFDTMGLLDTTFFNHQVYYNKSIGQLLEIILDDAVSIVDQITYRIDPALYDVTIPVAWFAYASHMQALKRIAASYFVDIYCDRAGAVVCSLHTQTITDTYDTWSDSTNVMTKDYPTLHNPAANYIEVAITDAHTELHAEALNYTTPISVDGAQEYTFNFSSPYVDNATITVDCDATVQYTYVIYGWGIAVNVSGTGTIRQIRVVADILKVEQKSTVISKDSARISLDGKMPASVASDFIQTSDRAKDIADTMLAAINSDKYNVEATYRGDIALSISDPIKLNNGIAPSDKYSIKRHSLYWDGGLSGKATLNT